MTTACDANGLLSLEMAKQRLDNLVSLPNAFIEIALGEAVGRVLATPVNSPINVPGFDNSAMDGYAVRAEDVVPWASFRLIGKALAGQPSDLCVSAGECIRITTGAKMPAGADAVVMQEQAVRTGESVQFQQAATAGQFVRRAGEDICCGQVVLPAGQKLSAIDIGLLTSIGIETVTVWPTPTVALFSTGDELRLPGQSLPDGCIYDTNRPALRALLQHAGFEVLDLGLIADDPAAIRHALLRADADADVIITSGGVSVGEADFVGQILAELGDIDSWKLAIKPGKPMLFGRLPQSLFFGLPGNPVSAMVTFYQLVLPSLRRMSGQQQQVPMRIKATASAGLKKQPGRTDFQRGICTQDPNGEWLVTALPNQSSGVLSSISRANCFIVLERERGNVAAGETVWIEPFDAYLRAI